jgi:hypothetical protein
LDEFFLRLLEARDSIALPRFRLSFLAPFSVPAPDVAPRRLFLVRSLGACGIHSAPLRVIERRVLGPRARKPFLQVIEPLTG